MNYDLYLGDVRIGSVTVVDEDFPNTWGRVTYDDALSIGATPELARLRDFLELSRQWTRLLDVSHEKDVDSQMEAIDQQLNASFAEYAESEDWRLVDEAGNPERILVPLFRDRDGIVWRWAPPTWETGTGYK